MSDFKVSKHFKALPGWKFTGAQIQLAHWLKKKGHLELAGHVCAAASNAALTPHLAEVDKVLPTEVTREHIFPKVFTDPLTIRQELTAMIGESVRHHPREDELNIEDKVSILTELKDQIEEVGGKTKFSREIERFMKSDQSAEDYEDRLDALIIEAGGYLTGLKGGVLDETIIDVTRENAEHVVDKNIFGALAFLDLVGQQVIDARGILRMSERKAANTFLLGAGKVWDKTPRFMEILSSYWGKVTYEVSEGAPKKLSKDMGQVVSQIIEPRLQLGIAARLPKSKMISSLHLLEVEKLIYARGWLKGLIEYNEAHRAGKWVSSLRKNVSTILVKAVISKNPGYVVQAAAALPMMLDAIADKASEVDEELAEVLLSNQGTIINHALVSGKLDKYPRLVFQALPKMLDAITTSANELDDEIAEVLLSNKRTIINHALDSGKLEKYLQALFKALPKIVDAIAAEASELDEELAEVLLSNRRTIISHAITSGKLDKYPQAVFDALPKIVDAIAHNAAEFDEELAEVLLSNQRTIIQYALSSGKLTKYPPLVFRILPKIVDAIAVKASELDEKLTKVLLSNRGSIINRAISSGRLESYIQAVFQALPKMVDAIADKADELDKEVAEVLLSNQGTIISHALHSGKLERYPQNVFEALPKIRDAITTKTKELDEELAEVLRSNKATIIYQAINSGKLEKYAQAVFEALPKMVDTIAAKANEMDDELAEVLLSNKTTIINRALKSGKLETYVEAVSEALPQMVQDMDRASISLALASGKLDV
jgi:23S rRNA maturation-related 3'-5' exoribonuclease YhaM